MDTLQQLYDDTAKLQKQNARLMDLLDAANKMIDKRDKEIDRLCDEIDKLHKIIVDLDNGD